MSKEDELPEVLNPEKNPVIRPELPWAYLEPEKRSDEVIDSRAPIGRAAEVAELARKLLGCADARIEDDVRIDRDAGGRITVDGKDPAEVGNDVIERLYELKVPEE